MSETIDSTLDERFADAMMGTFAPPLAFLDHGEGAYVWDVDGKRYLDFLGGIAVNSLGHAHPVFVEAVSEQAAKLAHVSNYFASRPQLALAETLKRISGAGDEGRVIFGNSGAEAMEAAFKLARLNCTGPRTRILTLKGSFHGRTMGSLSLTGQPALQKDFAPLVPGVEHIDPSVEALEAAVDETVAAVIFEPIQGEAGVVDLPEGFIARARELTTTHAALLIIDEIQTGVGRTGTWFAFEQFGVTPDAIAVAKGLAGGFPIGALVTFGEASALLQRGHHGSTFGGNPLATAVGGAVLGEIESAGLIGIAGRRGEQIRALVAGLDSPHISAVRGRGLLIGIGLTEPRAKELSSAALELGLIINAPNDHSIRIAPPLIVGDTEVDEFGRLFAAALASLDSSNDSAGAHS